MLTSWSSFGGGGGAGIEGFFIKDGGGGGGGCSGGLGSTGISFAIFNPNGRAPPNPPFSGSGNSPGVSDLSSTEESKAI